MNGQDQEFESLKSFSGSGSANKSEQIVKKNPFSRLVEAAVEYPPLVLSTYEQVSFQDS